MKKIAEIKRILSQYKEEVRKKYGVKEIGIFGSFVRNEQKPTSDVDILVEFEKPVSLLQIVSLENYLSDMLGIKVDVVPKKNIRVELKENILSGAVPV
jgi:predicted nucleotidyltransferase